MRSLVRGLAVLVVLVAFACGRRASLPSEGYFFKTADAACARMWVEETGTLGYGNTGFCQSGGQFERTRKGAVALVCKGHNGTKDTVVYDVTLESGALSLSSSGQQTIELLRSQADCERTITVEDRTVAAAAAKRRGAEAAKQWRDQAKHCCECLAEAKAPATRCLTSAIDGCIERLLVGNHSMTESYCLRIPCEQVCRNFR
jgi:hypothetical protein